MKSVDSSPWIENLLYFSLLYKLLYHQVACHQCLDQKKWPENGTFSISPATSCPITLLILILLALLGFHQQCDFFFGGGGAVNKFYY